MQILSCSQHACSEIFRENFKIPCISRLSSFKKNYIYWYILYMSGGMVYEKIERGKADAD